MILAGRGCREIQQETELRSVQRLFSVRLRSEPSVYFLVFLGNIPSGFLNILTVSLFV